MAQSAASLVAAQCHVLQRIGQYLKYGSAYHPPSPAALIPLMCCSKRFLNIFAEVLYRDVSLTQLDHLDAYSTYLVNLVEIQGFNLNHAHSQVTIGWFGAGRPWPNGKYSVRFEPCQHEGAATCHFPERCKLAVAFSHDPSADGISHWQDLATALDKMKPKISLHGIEVHPWTALPWAETPSATLVENLRYILLPYDLETFNDILQPLNQCTNLEILRLVCSTADMIQPDGLPALARACPRLVELSFQCARTSVTNPSFPPFIPLLELVTSLWPTLLHFGAPVQLFEKPTDTFMLLDGRQVGRPSIEDCLKKPRFSQLTQVFIVQYGNQIPMTLSLVYLLMRLFHLTTEVSVYDVFTGEEEDMFAPVVWPPPDPYCYEFNTWDLQHMRYTVFDELMAGRGPENIGWRQIATAVTDSAKVEILEESRCGQGRDSSVGQVKAVASSGPEAAENAGGKDVVIQE